MAYPTTEYPAAKDAVVSRANGQTIDADDYNYPDGQIRALQDVVGSPGQAIGEGTSNEGPGGLLSSVASGASAIAHRFMSRAAFTAGKLISVGDNYDAAPPAYTEKMHLTYQGVMWLLGGLQIDSSPVITDILDEDLMTSDSDTALSTQQAIKAYVDASISGFVTIGLNKPYTEAAIPIEEVCGQVAFDGGLGPATFDFVAVLTTSLTTGNASIILYDLGPVGSPTAPRTVTTLTTAVSGGPQVLSQTLTVVGAAPGVNEVLDADHVYEVVVTSAAQVGDTVFVGSARIEVG